MTVLRWSDMLITIYFGFIKGVKIMETYYFKFYHVYREDPYKAYVRVVKLSFAKSSARDYNTIRARLKCVLGFKLNPTKLLVFKDGKYEYLSKEGL